MHKFNKIVAMNTKDYKVKICICIKEMICKEINKEPNSGIKQSTGFN